MNLNSQQLAALAAGAGFSGTDLITAVAVALAESEGNPQAYNPEKAAGAPQGQGSYGLWQIYLHAHPEDASKNLFDPQQNADAAFSVYSDAGNSFRPWSTFQSGAYLVHLADATLGAAAIAGPAPSDTVASDGSSTDGSGPGTGGILAIVTGGTLFFWLLERVLNG